MNEDDRIQDLERQVDHWKGIAAYLASCHAATLECWPKNGSKRERRRLVQLCQSCEGYLGGPGISTPPFFKTDAATIAQEIARCREAAKNHEL